MDFKEQRICIKFCFNLQKTVAETHRMLQKAFGDNAMSQSKTFLQYKRFKDGWTSVDDNEHSGRPSTSTTPENIAKVHEAILADCRQTIHNVCEMVEMSYGTVAFWRTICTWDAFLQYLCQDCWVTIRRPIAFLSAWNSNKPEMTSTSSPIS
jgi:hypothetical protein